MRIRVKHKETEFIVEDDDLRTDTYNNLIHFNQEYVIKLIKEMTDNIIKIIEGGNK